MKVQNPGDEIRALPVDICKNPQDEFMAQLNNCFKITETRDRAVSANCQ
ncbi:MAG: hypothetical protein KME08_12585 [Aphanothece sp. CMT-3BRIN-NPC111]|nr:hypothetical protein [Aphanothece sp. CMT-3BRIN-NPC111]